MLLDVIDSLIYY